MRCASRLGVTVGLAGGVVRNVLLAEGTVSAEYDSLYDFVDPLGDIDLVLTEEAIQAVFARALFAEVPFADCHVWDLQTVEDRKSVARRGGSVAADRLIVWFKGMPGQSGATTVESIDSEVDRNLQEPLRPAVTLNFQTEIRPAEISRFIKFARMQMRVESADRLLIDSFAQLRNQFDRLDPRRRRSFNRRARFQIELELAQLFMTGPDWRQVSAFRAQLREVLLGDWLPEGSTLRQMLTVEPKKDMRVGAAVYKPSAQAPLKVDFMTAEAEDNRSGGSNRSRIPWTRLKLENRGERSCCPYSDFEEGIAVIVWRNTESEATREDQRLPEGDYGLLAYPIGPTQSPQEVLMRNRRIPMLGYVRKGRSIATCLDPAYLKLITGGKFSVFMVGLVSILASGGVNPPSTEPPLALAPDGEAGKVKDQSSAPAYAVIEDEGEVRHERTPITA
jgi:hypothetical protein